MFTSTNRVLYKEILTVFVLHMVIMVCKLLSHPYIVSGDLLKQFCVEFRLSQLVPILVNNFLDFEFSSHMWRLVAEISTKIDCHMNKYQILKL